MGEDRAGPLAVGAALLALYLIWGSTYLAIRFAIETIPPLLMASARWILAGGALYAFARLRGAAAPTLAHWRTASVVGLALIVGGNGLVTVAEQWVESGLTALVIATVPLWMVLFEAARPGGARPGGGVLVGVALGLVGVALLVGPTGLAGPVDPVGAVFLLLAAVSWAAGSIWSRSAPHPSSLLLAIGMQSLVGGVALASLGLAFGEASAFELAAVSAKSLAALAFLVVLGSIVGFSAYAFLLKVTSAAKVSTYAFVNPVVAVLLGWAVAGETVTGGTLVAAALILVAVAIILWNRARGAPPVPPAPARANAPE